VISLILICCLMTGLLMFLLGSYLSYNLGYGDGWDDGQDFCQSPATMRWIRLHSARPAEEEEEASERA
jgi:hypothetical protein